MLIGDSIVRERFTTTKKMSEVMRSWFAMRSGGGDSVASKKDWSTEDRMLPRAVSEKRKVSVVCHRKISIFIGAVMGRFVQSPNKAPEPTITSVTPPAYAGVAPAALVAHL